MADSDNSVDGIPLIEPAFTPGKKRKRADAEARREKRKRRSKKPSDIHEEDIDTDLGVNLSIAKMDPHLLVKHVARRIQSFSPDLTPVELEDLRIDASCILDTSSFSAPRTADQLPQFLRRFSADPSSLCAAPTARPGEPHTLLLTSSGLRAADLVRALRCFQAPSAASAAAGPSKSARRPARKPGKASESPEKQGQRQGRVAKLFAKHIKLSAAIGECGETYMSMGVGTPQRLFALLEAGALRVDGLERVLVDASFVDVKRRGVLDMREMVGWVARVLGRSEVRDRMGEEGVRVLFF